MRRFVLAVAILALAAAVSAADSSLNSNATVFYSPWSGSFSLSVGVLDKEKGVAWATFEDTLNVTGWGVLNVETKFASNSMVTDPNRMYYAGVLEGCLTGVRIHQHLQSMKTYFFQNGPVPSDVLDFLNTQNSWTDTQVKEKASTSRYWQYVGLLQQQLKGLADGVKQCHPDFNMSELDMQILQATGDLLDIIPALKPEVRPNWKNMTDKEVEMQLVKTSLCSGLIKVSYDFEDLYSAHSSWFTYSAMNRIYKHYNFELEMNPAAQATSFSSYPGFLESLDDFYQMSSGLVMVQTTNSIIDHTLYDLVKPQSLLAWQRVRTANALATTGEEWYDAVKQYNSGTYNNQYMIVNYNLFTPGQPLKNGTLFVCEQIPGLVYGEDLTHQLERGYFPSYNIPTFDIIYQRSGYPTIEKQIGPSQSYALAARGQIFRRDQATVKDVDSLKALMRSNEYKTDPISNGNTFRAICSRGDFNDPKYAGGCYDTKVTNVEMHKKMTSFALNGPTRGTDNDQYKAFSWSEWPAATRPANFGQPDTFDFDFVQMTPEWIKSQGAVSPSTATS